MEEKIVVKFTRQILHAFWLSQPPMYIFNY